MYAEEQFIALEQEEVGQNGIATASIEKSSMRAMKRITDNIVLVFMK